jgi:hypothetical protein
MATERVHDRQRHECGLQPARGKEEFRARHDRLNRSTDTKVFERRFETLTRHVIDRPHKQICALAKEEFRGVDTPGSPDSAVPNQFRSVVDDFITVTMRAPS